MKMKALQHPAIITLPTIIGFIGVLVIWRCFSLWELGIVTAFGLGYVLRRWEIRLLSRLRKGA